MARASQFLIAVDQVLNTLTRDGWADETLSAHAWRKRNDSDWARWCRAIDWIFLKLFGQEDHCRKSFEAELVRAHIPVEMRAPPSDTH